MYSDGKKYIDAAENILQDLRKCPPLPGFEKVEIPGERERDSYEQNQQKGVAIPLNTWTQMLNLAKRLNVESRLIKNSKWLLMQDYEGKNNLVILGQNCD